MGLDRITQRERRGGLGHSVRPSEAREEGDEQDLATEHPKRQQGPGKSVVPKDAVVILSNAWELPTGLETWTPLVALIMSSFSRVMGQRRDRIGFKKIVKQESAARDLFQSQL